MYTEIRNIQILVAMLKAYNVRDIVMAPGGSDIPIIHSIETDQFFKCYSVVDERSLVYFAMGLSQQKNVPVACICTSGTAVCNFLPGMTEAFYQDVPLIAITADKNPYRLNQLETQKIDQTHIFNGVCKKSVSLPVINTAEEEWYCERLINEALVELYHHGAGPVHINIPVMGKITIYNVQTLPEVRKINYILEGDPDDKWSNYVQKLKNTKNILIVVGQNINFDEKMIELLNKFFATYDCAISVEHLSNLKCNGSIITYPITDSNDKNIFSKVKPDLVISMGNNVASAQIKPMIRLYAKECEHWQIDPAGRIRDMFSCLTAVFECSVKQFFEHFVKEIEKEVEHTYYNKWVSCISKIEIPEVDFSDFWVVQKLSQKIPSGSVLHSAILDSTRLFQFFNIAPEIKAYSNVGALGIDGCLSTFLGQAAATDALAFCVLGDLSYFYDMNATGIRHVRKNVRIILLNNGGASEFHFIVGKNNISTINNYISAEHKKRAESWAESLKYDCYVVTSKKEFEDVLPILTSKSDRPIFVEVVTDMESDADVVKAFYKNVRRCVGGTKSALIDSVKSELSDEQKQKVKSFFSRFKK